MPPFHTLPPQAGMPALETNHAYNVKNSAVVLAAARCNNDVSPLFRISGSLLDFLKQTTEGEGDKIETDSLHHEECEGGTLIKDILRRAVLSHVGHWLV